MNTDALELPPIDAALIDTPAPRTDVAVAAAAALDLSRVDIHDVVRAQFAPLAERAAAAKKEFATVVLDLPNQSKIDEAKSLRQRRVNAEIADTRKLGKGQRSALSQAGKTSTAEEERIVGLFTDAAAPLTQQIDAAQAKIDAAKEAEKARLQALRDTIDGIMAKWLERCNVEGMTAERLGKGIEGLEMTPTPGEVIDVADYWRTKKQETLQAMDKLKAAAAAREESARLEAQRLENERKAAELAEREAALKRAEEEAAAREQASREQAAFEDWVNKTSPSGDVESVQRQWEASAEYHDLHGIEYRPATMATTEGKAETPGAGSAEAAPLADDWDDIPACPGCGAMAGCCQDFPNCPGGQAATSQPAPGGSPAKTSEVNDDDESDRGRARRLAGAGDEDSVGPDRRADDSARDDGAAAHNAGLLRALAHGDPCEGDAEHAGLTNTPSEAALRQAADFELRTDPPPPVPASDTAHATDIASRVILLQEPEPEPIDALLLDCLALVNHAAQAFEGRFPSHPKPEQAWWAELRERINRVRPGLLTMTWDGA